LLLIEIGKQKVYKCTIIEAGKLLFDNEEESSSEEAEDS
jgi:hypothetical protein